MTIIKIDLAGENNLIPRDVEIAQRLANVFFGSAEGVAVRGVDEVDALADDFRLIPLLAWLPRWRPRMGRRARCQ